MTHPANLIMKLSIAILLFAVSVHAQTPAFPGCDGAGKFTTGGRGGSVFVVTNLNNDGPGSLADAVSAPYRIVTFAVSGIIDLTEGKADKPKGGKLVIDKPDITILGQTAPGEGICLKGGSLVVSASNVIVRYIRSRRGFVRDTDSGDAIEFKPPATGLQEAPAGESQEKFDKRKQKKADRGKEMKSFAPMERIVLDHCSASWATDEDMTITHADKTTVSYCIAAEGLDYTNEKQTPPNHSEGSLWGSAVADGRATMHHTLYAHNRLRNPRTMGGTDVPAVLTFYNNAVYDWSEYPTHTGSERVHLQWLGNYYKPGPSTPADIRGSAFQFHGDPMARVFAQGNVIEGSDAATKNNALAVGWNSKFNKVGEAERKAMIVTTPFTELPAALQSAEDALGAIIADAGAILPARDAVDLRIMHSVREGTGKIIEKETDLPEGQRWPDYRALPAPADSDHDGIPDFWETQFGLNPHDAGDSAKISAGGFANIEHYANNTDPTGKGATIASISADVSRASLEQLGEWRITRSGDVSQPLTVHYKLGGDAKMGSDYAQLYGTTEIAAGKRSKTITLDPRKTAADNRTVVMTLQPGECAQVGCPSESLIVIRR